MATWEYPPRIIGGISRHCQGLAEALAQMGNEVSIVTISHGELPSYEEKNGVKIFRVNANRMLDDFIDWVLDFNTLLNDKVSKLYQESPFDVLHIHDWLTVFAGESIKNEKIPFITTVHSTEYGRSNHSNSVLSNNIRKLEDQMISYSDEIIVASKFMEYDVKSQYLPDPYKVNVIPNGIDVSRYSIQVDKITIRRMYGVTEEDYLILYVGRLEPVKGIDYIIKSAPIILEKYPKSKFIVVGEGGFKDKLVKMAQSNGSKDSIFFTGFLKDKALDRLILSSDIFTIPSIYEPFGIVALEAMAAGIPIVASNVGGLSEILNNEYNGILFPPRDHNSLAEGVIKLLDDSELYHKIRNNGKVLVSKKFTWSQIAEETIKVYDKALTSSSF
jgi:glycosyltransferase involved in cell wall biosynthesis